MSSTTRYYELAKLHVRVYNDIMMVESDEKMYAEENPQGDFPERQIYERISTGSSDEEESGFNPRTARRKRAARPGPPAKMPTGQLLTPQEAKRHRGMFSVEHKDRKTYVKELIKRYKPRKVLVRKYRQMIKVHDGPAVPREESCDSIEDLVLENRDNQENEDPDDSESSDSVEEEGNETDSDSGEMVGGGWFKKRVVVTSSDTNRQH